MQGHVPLSFFTQVTINMNIRQKFMLTPGLVLALMLVLGFVGFFGLRSSNVALDEIYNTQFQNFKSSSNALQNVGAAHADVYRLFTWLSNYDDAKIKQASTNINNRIDKAIEEIKALAANSHLTDEGQKNLTEIQADLAKYRKQVANAIDMAQVDPNLGITGMQTADRLFTGLQSKAEALISEGDASAKAEYQSSVTSYKVVISIFITLVIAAFVSGSILSIYMSNMIISPLKVAISAAQRIALGNLQGKIHTTQTDETGDLLKALAGMQDKLKEMIGGINKSSQELTLMASSVNDSSGRIVNGTSDQHDAAASMASSIEELSVSINVVSENSHDADIAVGESAKLTREGRAVLAKMDSAMQQISTSVNESANIIHTLGQESERISEIIKVIKDIADQTNLLALNAAIEAARAGDQGRGFAVVADEVRKLAERTANSTQEISSMIQGIQNNTQGAVASMKQGVDIVSHGSTLTSAVSSVMAEVEKKSTTVSGMVSEISSALKEQATASHDIATHVESIAQRAEENSIASKETASSAQRMSVLASNMEQMVSHFSV
jgi:methyl-accepting chemotaxis protein